MRHLVQRQTKTVTIQHRREMVSRIGWILISVTRFEARIKLQRMVIVRNGCQVHRSSQISPTWFKLRPKPKLPVRMHKSLLPKSFPTLSTTQTTWNFFQDIHTPSPNPHSSSDSSKLERTSYKNISICLSELGSLPPWPRSISQNATPPTPSGFFSKRSPKRQTLFLKTLPPPSTLVPERQTRSMRTLPMSSALVPKQQTRSMGTLPQYPPLV